MSSPEHPVATRVLVPCCEFLKKKRFLLKVCFLRYFCITFSKNLFINPFYPFFISGVFEPTCAYASLCLSVHLYGLDQKSDWIIIHISESMVHLQAIASHLPDTPMMVYGTGRWAHFNMKLHFLKVAG